jgi:hypothetical protein
MVEKNQSQIKEIPVGVRIISVLYYILAALLLIVFIIVIINIDIEIANRLIISVFLLGFSILSFFIGKGLWEGDKWSRVIVIVISILSIIVTIVAIIVISYLSRSMFPLNGGQNIRNIVSVFDISKFIPKAIISIIINGIIAGYLLFSSKVKKSFK